MSAWAFCVAYNEATIIPYWVRHYRTFCARVIVYVDQDTTDDTAALARREGAETRVYPNSTGLDDIAFVQFAEAHYPEARGHADWVIWTDADEILYHPQMRRRLLQLRRLGVNYPTVTGFSMMADAPPTTAGQIYDELQRGFSSDAYSKVAIFDPELDVHWQTGKHKADVRGATVTDDGSDPIQLLHYRWLGQEYFLERNRRNYARLNALNKSLGHGREIYPQARGDYTPEWYQQQRDAAKVLL